MHGTIGRRTTLAALGGAALAAGTNPVTAQPGRTGRAIVGFPPGGTADTVTRLYVERLRAQGAAQMVVDNRPGAGGRLALELLKPLAPDGTSFIVTPASMMTIYPHLYPRTLRYDPLKDFTPVAPICLFPFGLAVSARHPAKTLQEFVAWGKTQPAVDWASPVPGSMGHFIGSELARLSGITMNHVPYRGSAPAAADLLAGTLHAVMLPLGDLTAFHRSGDARLLAVSSPQRPARVAELPTFAESGYPDLVHQEWYGALLPANAAPATVSALHEALATAAASTEVKETLTRIDLEPTIMEPAAFRDRIAREIQIWGPIVAASGFKPDE
jgi:tripartite-type tricarboxylate transporter receptor subunit TctC